MQNIAPTYILLFNYKSFRAKISLDSYTIAMVKFFGIVQMIYL